MLKRKDLVIGILALAIVAGAVLVWMAPWTGERAPDVTFVTLDGDEIRLAERRGKPTLVNFWATTCTTCIQEMPYLVELYEELAPHGFEIVGVAMEYDPPRQVEALVEARSLNYAIALDRDGSIARAFGQVRLTPTTFLVGPRGDIAHKRLGLLDMERLREQIIDMLPAEAQAQIRENKDTAEAS